MSGPTGALLPYTERVPRPMLGNPAMKMGAPVVGSTGPSLRALAVSTPRSALLPWYYSLLSNGTSDVQPHISSSRKAHDDGFDVPSAERKGLPNQHNGLEDQVQ